MVSRFIMIEPKDGRPEPATCKQTTPFARDFQGQMPELVLRISIFSTSLSGPALAGVFPHIDPTFFKGEGSVALRSADEHDLAGRAGFKDLLVRPRRLGKWQFLANDGAQRAVFESCKKSGMDVRLFDGCNRRQH